MIKKTDWGVYVDDMSLDFKKRLFKSRDVKESELDIGIEAIHDYINLPDIESAVFEITTAIKKRKRIKIFGDYDVDGTCATTILVRFFRMINYDISYHIPDRMTEGYGISDAAADKIIKDADCDLIITVDNGIAAVSQIKRIMDAGISVVVTDHHECKAEIPACPVIDCKRPDSEYEFPELCGAAVAMKLAWALCDEFKLPADSWQNFIEYAAIATVADVVPLVDENRAIVKLGLEKLKRTNKTGLRNLIRAAGKLDNILQLKATDIGFYIAPLINASSRIGDVHIAMDLMLTDDMDEAIKKADELKGFNDKRKEVEAAIYQEANMSLIKEHDFTSVDPIIVVGDDWHKGVIGIVAARLVEAYSRPAIVLSKNKNGVCHGSCRTFGDISIIEMLDSASDLMLTYGGHVGAAGLSLSYDNLEAFKARLSAYAKERYSLDMFQTKIMADIEVKLNEITLENFELIDRLEPFGAANHDPVFLLKGVKVISKRKMGQKEGFENAHLKITVADQNSRMNKEIVEGVGFYNSEFVDVMDDNELVDIIFKPSINEWKDTRTPQMMIKDIHCSIRQKDGVTMEEDALYTEDEISIAEIAEEYGLKPDDYIPTKNECYFVYKALCMIIGKQANKVLITDMDILSLVVSAALKKLYVSPFKLARIIEINSEAGYFYYKKMPQGKIFLALTDGQNIKMVADTDAFKKIEEERIMCEAYEDGDDLS